MSRLTSIYFLEQVYMSLAEFRQSVKNELQYGSKRVAYLYSKNGEIEGGMCDSREEAFSLCHEILKGLDDRRDSNFNIAVYKKDNIDMYETGDIILSYNKLTLSN